MGYSFDVLPVFTSLKSLGCENPRPATSSSSLLFQPQALSISLPLPCLFKTFIMYLPIFGMNLFLVFLAWTFLCYIFCRFFHGDRKYTLVAIEASTGDDEQVLELWVLAE